MKGILKLAYKLLVNDKAKFTALLVGITFAVFLIIQMTAMFAGIKWTPLSRPFFARNKLMPTGSGF